MLKETLINIWEGAIKDEYMSGMFCSERNLQAELYHQLKKAENLNGYKFWVEPSLSFENGQVELTYAKPDVLITKHDKVVCIIELKYYPQKEVKFQDDLLKMKKFESYRGKEKLRLYTNPHNGNYKDDGVFDISEQVLCVFGVVTKDDAWAVKPDVWTLNEHSIKPENFLHLLGRVFWSEGEPEFSAV